MVIEKVHGLQATGLSLNERFTMLAAPPEPWVRTPRRRPSTGPFFNQNNPKNMHLIEQIARRLEQQTKRQSLRQRLGVSPGALRRFGSESSLPGLRRSNSFSNLNQRGGVKSRISWRQSNGNLNRSASFGNLSQGAWRGHSLRGSLRGFRRRGGGTRALRGRFRGALNSGRVGWVQRGAARGRGAGRGRGRGAGRAAGAQRARRGAARGLGRGGMLRNQPPKPVPTKEELDLQLDQYMASTKSALDAELDTYMKNAMDLE